MAAELGKYALIDPPVGPWSTVKSIIAWRERLLTLPESPERSRAVAKADALLEVKNAA